MFHCGSCGFVKKKNVAPLDFIYEYVYGDGDFLLTRPNYNGSPERNYLKQFIAELSSKEKTSSYLIEIGPGKGLNMQYAKDFGYKVSSVDVSATNNKYYKQVLKFDEVLTSIEKAKDEYYDAAILTHVIEHVDNPNQMLASLYKKMKNKGKIIISTPNTSSLFGILFGYKWWPYLADDHVSMFNTKNLISLLEQHNFKIICKYTANTNVVHSVSQFIKLLIRTVPAEPERIGIRYNTINDPTVKRNSLIKKFAISIKWWGELCFHPITWIGKGYESVIITEK